MKRLLTKKQKRKTQLSVQIILFILVTGSLSGMLITTDVYSDVKNGIVDVLCLSCLKLDPKTTVEFTFDTVDDAAHPSYVLDNLSSGIVFLHFSEDACPGCDIMDPVIKSLLSVDFEKDELFSTQINFKSENLTYYYTNIDHAPSTRAEPFYSYDVRDIKGLPMFTIISLGYDKGIIKPVFATLYGTLGEESNDKRAEILAAAIDDAIALWVENIPGYEP